MSSGTIIEISSDDEGCAGNNSDISVCSWTTESSEHVAGEVDEGDNVKADCEVSSSTVCNQDSASTTSRKADLCNDSDDDCVIVENKPDSKLAIGDDCDGGGEVDELFIVRETGELACRDYPHPRYLCAKFPFSMTPHQKHCTMCHCYVCDSPAPCVHWNFCDPIGGHCHATHKDKSWRAERAFIRERNKKPVDPLHVANPSSKLQHSCFDSKLYHGSASAIRSVKPSTLLPDNMKTNPRNQGVAFSFSRQVSQPPLDPPSEPPSDEPHQMRALAGSSLTAASMQSFPRFKRSATKRSSARMSRGH